MCTFTPRPFYKYVSSFSSYIFLMQTWNEITFAFAFAFAFTFTFHFISRYQQYLSQIIKETTF